LGVDAETLDYKVETSKYKIAYLKDFGIYFMMFKTDNNNFKYMNSVYVKEIFDSIRNQFDIILVDTPPCGLVSDALFFAQVADAAYYVVLQDAVRVSKIKNGFNNLMSTDINILGCILNGATDVLLTGEYVILGIEDDISDSGYTTTFKLLRDYGGVEAQQKYVNSEQDHVAVSVQKSYDNDWK
jgi:Mrp family chromosome partitioning ATPase